jgi:DUF4097 and DUF4098 domain-containing protein YvlB
MRPRSRFTLFALVAVAAAALPAQSSKTKRERDIERTAEQIGRTVERAIDGAMRAVEKGLDQATRSYQSGRHDDRDAQQGADRVDTTFSFSRTGVVDLTSINGDISVTGWSRAQVRVLAHSDRGRLRWSHTSSRVTIETESNRGRTGGTAYELSVPHGVRVIMRSTSGDLSAKGTRGDVDANTTNGNIDVSEAGDRVELQSLSGDITASNLGGEVRLSSVSGEVTVDNVDARSLRVESTSGDLALTGIRSKDVAAETVNGDVSYQGAIESGGQYEFHSHSGNITIDIPANASARFSVETFSGELDSAFPVTIQPSSRERKQGRRIDFSLGAGNARVIAETFSGDVEIRRDTRREVRRGP